MTDFKVALRGTLDTTVDGEQIIATTAEAIAGTRNDVIATPASVANYFGANLLSGLMPVAIYDPQLISSDVFARANQTGTQAISTITGLQAALNNTATSAQGALADTAVQSVQAGTNVSVDDTDPKNPIVNVTGGAGVTGPASSVVGNLAAFSNISGSALADSGFNPSALGDLAYLDEVSIADINATGTPDNTTYLRGDGTWFTPASGGDFVVSIVEGTGIDVDATDPENPIVSIQAGYLGTAAFQPSTAFATSAQGALADTALQLDDVGVVVQAFDADLSSWAGVTRASGFDTFAATPSSANFAALVSDETGTGPLVFATSPTLITPALGVASATSLTLTTDLAIADGGTGASTAAAAFTALKQAATTSDTGVVELSTPAELIARTASRAITPDILPGAKAAVSLAYSATRSLVWTDGWYRTCTLTGNITISNASAIEVGDTIMLRLVGDSGTQRSVAWDSYYKGNLPEDTVTSTRALLVTLTATSSTEIAVSHVVIE